MPSLGAILAYILEILGLVQSIKSVVENLAPPQGNVAVETAPYEILLNTIRIDAATENLPTQFSDVLTQIAAVRLDTTSPHLATLTDVLDAIALLTPVTLPTTPPPGYGGASLTDIWAQTLEVGQMCALD